MFGTVLVQYDKFMLALEIQINDGKPLVVGTEDITYAFLTRNNIRNVHSILVGGSDDAFQYKWLDKIMQDSDRVLIRVVEVDKVAPPFEMEKNNRERMKQYFNQLKKELQDKQLL